MNARLFLLATCLLFSSCAKKPSDLEREARLLVAMIETGVTPADFLKQVAAVKAAAGGKHPAAIRQLVIVAEDTRWVWAQRDGMLTDHAKEIKEKYGLRFPVERISATDFGNPSLAVEKMLEHSLDAAREVLNAEIGK